MATPRYLQRENFKNKQFFIFFNIIFRIFDPADIPHGTIDIPIWAQKTSGYCGSLAHKCNHSFYPNAQFVVFDHPKFGLIPCVSTIADISKGEEVRQIFEATFILK